jgi:hypothetical protein
MGLRNSRPCSGSFQAPELIEMMSKVDDVVAPPLIGTQGPKKKMSRDALKPKALAAGVDLAVHAIHLFAETIEEIGTARGQPVELSGAREERGRCAPRHPSKRQHGDLQKPLDGRTVVAGGFSALESGFQGPAGTAAGENKMLDQLLRIPEPLVLARVQLAPFRGLVRKLGTVGLIDLLENGMHRRTLEQENSVGDTIPFDVRGPSAEEEQC